MAIRLGLGEYLLHGINADFAKIYYQDVGWRHGYLKRGGVLHKIDLGRRCAPLTGMGINFPLCLPVIILTAAVTT